MDFQNFQKSNFDGGKFLKIWSFINLPRGHESSHKKFGPDRFSRFDVYWIQTNRQTDKQTNRQTSQIFIEFSIKAFFSCVCTVRLIKVMTLNSLKNIKYNNFAVDCSDIPRFFISLFSCNYLLFTSIKNERLKFAAAYWVPSAGAEATGGKLFSAEGMHNCDLILITLPEG